MQRRHIIIITIINTTIFPVATVCNNYDLILRAKRAVLFVPSIASSAIGRGIISNNVDDNASACINTCARAQALHILLDQRTYLLEAMLSSQEYLVVV